MKISDFKIAEYLIRKICIVNNCFFVDCQIQFSATDGFFDGVMHIKPPDKLAKTVFQIVTSYLKNIDQISGQKCNFTNEERIAIINSTLAVVRDLSYSAHVFPEAFRDETVKLPLSRIPFVWTMMRDVICPTFDKPLQNTTIVATKSPFMDGAKYLQEGDIPAENTKFPFVFMNMSIENQPCRDAYLLYEVIRAHRMDPRGIIHDVFTKQEIWSKFYGLVRASHGSTNAINDFITTLSILSDHMGSIDKRLLQEKTSKWTGNLGLWTQSQMMQQYTDGPSTWWYLGLIEKMLEPSRGSDWSTYFTMKPFTDELWNKVEEEKKRRGLTELPMESLLRLQSEEFKMQPDLVIEGLLSDNRVW